MTRLIFDIETNGLLDTMDRIHSLVIKDADTGEVFSLANFEDHIATGVQSLMTADQIIGHNIIKFDLPAIKLVYPWFEWDESKVFDTLVASRLIWPDIKENDFNVIRKAEKKLARKVRQWEKDHRQLVVNPETDEAEWVEDGTPKPVYDGLPKKVAGRHSLEAWGHRLGEHKGDYKKEMEAQGLDPWAEWNPSMQSYCEQDVVVTEKLLHLIEKKNYSQQAFELEHKFQWIIAKQEQFGFPFDRKKAEALHKKLLTRRLELEEELQAAFPPWEVRTPVRPEGQQQEARICEGSTDLQGQGDHLQPRFP